MPEESLGPLRTAAIDYCLGIVQFTGGTEPDDDKRQATYFEKFFTIFAHYELLPLWDEVLKAVQEALKFPAEEWEQPASPSMLGSRATSSSIDTAAVLRAG